MTWNNLLLLQSRKFICGYCNHKVASNLGWDQFNDLYGPRIHVCPNCGRPTYFERSLQMPGVNYGNSVNDIDDKATKSLYEEARNCCSLDHILLQFYVVGSF